MVYGISGIWNQWYIYGISGIKWNQGYNMESVVYGIRDGGVRDEYMCDKWMGMKSRQFMENKVYALHTIHKN